MKQAREAYAEANLTTFHFAVMAKKFTAETFGKLCPACESEF